MFLIVLMLVAPIGARADEQRSSDAERIGHLERAGVFGPYAAVAPAQAAAARAATSRTALHYEIEARLDPDNDILAGSLRLDFVNSTDDSLYDLFFRLLPNIDFAASALTVTAIVIDGVDLHDPERYQTASWLSVRIPLPRALDPGMEVSVRLGFRIDFTSAAFSGLLGPSMDAETWTLTIWYPELIGYDQWSGWQLDGSVLWGGYTTSSVALYDVTLTLPLDFAVATNGRLVAESTDGGWVTRHYVAGPVHDFVAVAGDFQMLDESVGDTMVTVYVPPDLAEIGRAALSTAADALDAYGERYGAYPLRNLALVAMPLCVAAGLAFDGLILFDQTWIEDFSALDYGDGAFSGDERERLNRLIAHEVGHQWWGIFVTSEYPLHAFMVEGLTEYLAIRYIGWTHGEEAAERALIENVAEPYAQMIGYYGDAVPDLSAVGSDELAGYESAYIYGKAALGFLAINKEIGDEAFDAALQTYAEDFAFDFAGPADLRDAFEAASGASLGELWRFWFEDDDATVEDIRALIRVA